MSGGISIMNQEVISTARWLPSARRLEPGARKGTPLHIEEHNPQNVEASPCGRLVPTTIRFGIHQPGTSVQFGIHKPGTNVRSPIHQPGTHIRFGAAWCWPLIMVLCLLLLTACDPFAPPPPVKAPPDKQTFTIPVISDSTFATLDPARAEDSAAQHILSLLFTGLVHLDKQLNIRPQLAKSWQLAEDRVTWTFHLQPQLTFNDGSPLTAQDIAYSLDRALQPATQSTIAPLYLGLLKDTDKLLAGKISTLIGVSIKPLDPTTLVLVTREPAMYFLAALATPCAYVVNKKVIDKYGERFTSHLAEGAGAGPFTVAQLKQRQMLELIPDTHYYHGRPQLQKVTFIRLASAEDAYQAYLNKKVDMVEVASVEREREDFHQTPELRINYYSMNYLVKPFHNIKIRQAFALAIDKTRLAQTVLPTNHIVPQGLPGYNPKLVGPDGTENLKGNATKAQQLLQQGMQEEGWTSLAQLPALTLTHADISRQEVVMLVDMWQKVLHVTIKTEEFPYETLLDKVIASQNNPAGLQWWGMSWTGRYADLQDWLTLQFGKGLPYNAMNYAQNESHNASQQQSTQQLLLKADTDPNQQERLQHYQQAEQQLVNDVAWLPISQGTSMFLRTPLIVGIVDNAQNSIAPDDWATIYRVQ